MNRDGPPPDRPPSEQPLLDQHGAPLEPVGEGTPWTLLFFFPYAATPVCGGELSGLSARRAALAELGCRVLAVSCDARYSQRAWADTLGLELTLVSDHWPHGALARVHDAFDAGAGCARRVSVLLDALGRPRWREESEGGRPRDPASPERALAGLLA